MYLELPSRFAVGFKDKTGKRTYSMNFEERTGFDIPEVSSDEAPVSVRWVTNNTDRNPDGTGHQALWYGGRNYMRVLPAKKYEKLSERDKALVLFENTHQIPALENAKTFGEGKSDNEVAYEFDKNKARRQAELFSGKLLVIDGELHISVGTPVYSVNRRDLDNLAFAHDLKLTFRPFPGVNGKVGLKYYAADQEQSLVDECYGWRRVERRQVEILIPEALSFDGPAHELLNASLFMIDALKNSATQAMAEGDGYSGEELADIWTDLIGSFREARLTMDAADMSWLEKSLRRAVANSDCWRPGHSKEARYVRDIMARWDDRPLDLAFDGAPALGR